MGTGCQFVLQIDMWAAFLLGLTGSLGHCVGMCSGVAVLLGRRGQARGWRVLFLHMGRITTYSLMGMIAGGIGYAVIAFASYCAAPTTSSNTPFSALSWLQGGLALLTAVLSFYMALSLIGRVPSPELIFIRVTTWWGKMIRRAATAAAPADSPSPPQKATIFNLFSMGMLWGLLPCGLVMTGLVAAAVSGSPQNGALTMFVFGIGTWPVTVGIGIVARLKNVDSRLLMRPQFRYVASALVFAFGIQMALRGFAAWGVVNHYHVGTIMLW